MRDNGVRLTRYSLVRLPRFGLMRLTLDYLLVRICGQSKQEKQGAGGVKRSDQNLVSSLREQFG